MKKKLIIIDAFALIFRAYYAIPPLTIKDGTNVNAVYGFLSTVFNIIKKYNPEHICVAFDSEKPTFRKERYEEYKANRSVPPEDFKPQIPIILDLLKTLNITTYAVPGYEADDVIGTICAQKSVDTKDVMSYVLTGDLDTLQLVDDNTHVITFKKGMSEVVEYDEKAVEEKYEGLTVAQIIDMKAIKGDTSDNIPGVPGIGEVGAIKLLKEFGSLDNIYKNIESESIKPGMKKKLIEHKDLAYESQFLSRIVTNVPMNFTLEDAKIKPFSFDELTQKLQDLEFKSLIQRIPFVDGVNLVGESSESKAMSLHSKKIYTLINNEHAFSEFIALLKTQTVFSFDTETTSQNALEAELLGISFSFKKDEAYYVSIKNKDGDGLFKHEVNNESWLEQLKPIFANTESVKVAHNLKYDLQALKSYGVEIVGELFDTMIAAYLLNAGERAYSLDTLVLQEFSTTMTSYESLVGEGKNVIPLIDAPLQALSDYSCADANYTLQLFHIYKPELEEKELYELSKTIEMPLIKVLAEMEREGILVDVKFLNKLDKEVRSDIALTEKEIFKLAGKEFNVASPLQLQEILFVTLGISTVGIAKTKSGFSTAASELEKLEGIHPIIDLISQHRELSKIHSTYLVALPEMVNAKTKRIHTNYNQTIAATGRLSSINPNLQNIPVRTEVGKKIREAFIAKEGYVLLSADYSQIELRLAADASGDENMITIFNEGKDIHTSTAALIRGIPESEVTKEIRSTAKEINFGIIYGLGHVGLAQRTKMSRDEAKQFIENYFTKFPGIKKYLENSILEAKKLGFAQTSFGRRRYLPDLSSGNPMLRSAAERIAVNMPLQGTAADLIKIAMINIQKELKEISKDAKMLLQVHDELVFEVPEEEVEKISAFVKEKMEQAHKFKVPIVVDVHVGKNWGELK